ncbi:hypothetical protein, variant [Pseudogymnoascus destructans 20631-21]|uniref:WSC domain-containing protein n=1 Tax=Pseudogymnoascus destructans (strain ATCC MYA-4855 / 20631-21) TaxID=658429 RepID=L8G311_PSED2|nr:hypothetical protein, variant [Pseudogymnoascus destructans 20631-21]
MVAPRTQSAMSAATVALACLAPLGVLITTQVRPVQALTIAYCAGINTASRAGNYSIYQSNGLCQTFCQQSFAFAIVQDNLCWCSNYAPGASTASISKCSNECPGYPADLCGGADLYGYIKLDKNVVGTKTTDGTGVTAKPDKNPTTTSPPENAKDDSTSWTPTPITSVETVTGQVRVVTITPTAPPGYDSPSSGDNKKSLTAGGAAGLGIGIAAFLALIGALILFFIRRRKRLAAESDVGPAPPTPNTGYTPQRTMSENSRYVLGTDGRRVVEGWEGRGAGDVADTPVSAGSRRSRLMPVDPRLDPFAPVYQQGGLSGSRESVGSIQDNFDYSRRVVRTGPPILRATNPDA